jgi:hypothetical protein
MRYLAEIFVAILVLLARGLPGFLLDRWSEKAAERNEREFMKANPNSMNAWKHFP